MGQSLPQAYWEACNALDQIRLMSDEVLSQASDYEDLRRALIQIRDRADLTR